MNEKLPHEIRQALMPLRQPPVRRSSLRQSADKLVNVPRL